MKLEEVVAASGPWPEGATRARRRGDPALVAAGPGRRAFLAGTLAAATGAAVGVLGVVPVARPAVAAGPAGRFGYRVYRGSCPSYASSHNCEPGCGPSPVYADTCEASGSYRGWFKNRPAEGYRLRPGQCLSGYDAWVWRYSGQCHACRRVIEYRCHDGYKLVGGVWFNAICRHVTDCDGQDPDRPTTYSPVGAMTRIRRLAPDRIRLRGWAIDADRPQVGVPIRVTLDGRVIATQRANRRSNAVPALFRQYGLRHGFDITVADLPPGRHLLRVLAISLGRRGQNVELHRKTITVP